MKLRKLSLNDVKPLQKLFLEEKSLQDTGVNVKHDKITIKFMREWLKERTKMYNHKNPLFVVYAVINKQKKIIGTIGLDNINYKRKSAFIGGWIAKRHSGKGYCTIAIKTFLEKIKKMFTLKKVYAEASKHNFASCRVLEKNGFKIMRTKKEKLIFEKTLM